MKKTIYKRRRDGKKYAKYCENFSFEFRVKKDLLDERLFWDDWVDWRDGFRDLVGIYKNKGKYRRKYEKLLRHIYVDEKIILRYLFKWSKKEEIRKLRKIPKYDLVKLNL